jgi:internalin A
MTPEEAYAEALRRIREVEEAGALELDLSGLKEGQTGALEYTGLETLTRLPPELERLTSLQSLNLSWCEQLSGDLSPLAGLASLHSLNLYGCEQLSGDLSPLASLTSLQSLNLSGCKQLSGDLSPLASLTSLQSLDLSGCGQLSGDLAPLAHLTSLQSLDLAFCPHLSDLSPLAGLTSLQSLNLSGCGFRRFASLESLLPTLKYLYLFGCKFEDLPSEVCGERLDENVLNKVRAHYEDIKSGQRIDGEVKVLFLGNGGAGKTQLCRRLRDLPFDPNIPTTHGVQLGQTTVELDDFPEPVQLNLWDFGGQDIYHGSHSLFIHGQAIFLLLWTPALEHQTIYQEGELSLRHRRLSYWLDYLRAFAGTDASVLIVQSQCDTARDRASHPPEKVDDFFFLRWLEVSAKTGLGLNLVKAALEESVRDRFERRPPPPIGVGRVAMRDRLRQILEEDLMRESARRQHRLLERAEFDRICDEVGGVSDKNALLDFLHHNGVLFHRTGLFGDRIVLDQNWALEAIYAIFNREKILPLLRGYGRFSRKDLEALIWSGYAPEEQKVFLGMMESCGICFKVRELPNDEWEYLAPELLPEWSEAQEQLLGRLRNDPPDAEATAQYTFFHEGIMRGYLSKLGGYAKDAAIYWKYGCWFYEQRTRSQVLIESQWEDAASQAGAGDIRFRAWGERAEDLIEQLLRTLQTLPVGQPPEIKLIHNAKVAINAVASVSSHATVASGSLDTLDISVRHDLPTHGTPEIFISYAWGDDSSEDARKRTEVVDRLCETLGQEGWHILRDKTAMRYGDLISGFMKRIGLAGRVIVVLSDKYLRSPYCMTELYSIYQRSLGEKEDFLRRIIPLVLADARIGTWRDRVAYAEHWEAEFKAMEEKFRHLAESDFRLYKAMQEWHNRIGDMLAYVNDKLSPHGFDEIVKDDFAELRQMLQQRQ